jgi:hypothetical protein
MTQPLAHTAVTEDAATYANDLYAWTQTQAALLRRKAWNQIDAENLAEEIEDMGRSTRRELGSRLEVLLAHLLKWHYQPELRCGSWRGSIDEARSRIADILDDSPSLRSYSAEHLGKAWHRACARTEIETGLLHLPEACPWTIAQVLDKGFLP